MSLPKVSVIVPVYSVSKYIYKCLDSLINQTLKEVEIIIVNDASPDPEDDRICRAYASKDSRIKYLVHKTNKRQGGARNTGIMNASANFIGFVDSDDWVDHDMFEQLYNAIKKDDADISQCFFTEHIGSKTNVRKLKKFKKQKDFLNATNVLVWNKLFKKGLFIENNVFFPECHSHEDTATLPRLIYFANSMTQVKKPLYHYVVEREGATTANYEQIFSDHSLVFEKIQEFMRDVGVWHSHRTYFDKRLTRTLLHDIARLLDEDSLDEKSKEIMIKNGLDKSINLLIHPQEVSKSSLKEIEISLKHYKRRLIFRQLIQF